MPNIFKSKKIVKRPTPLTVCPNGPEGITFGTHWYKLPGIDAFFICTKCFEDKLANTPFAGLFDSFFDEPLPGSKSICDFNSQRIDQILTRAVKACNTDELFSFAEHRSNIPTCDGIGGTRGGHEAKWFNNPEMHGFVACGACYEDTILATSFASRFHPHPEEQPVEEVWICDLAIPYVKRSLVEFAKVNDWFNFVNAVNYRSSIPTCEAQPVILSTRKWFRPIRPWLIPKMMVCEACYLDHAGSLPTAFNFTRVHPKFIELQTPVLCSFRIKSIQAYSEQLLRDNYSRWHHLVSQMVTKPSCAKGEIEGDWYSLPDPKNSSRSISNFDLCGACYLGYIEATGHASAFRKVEYPAGTKRVCDFSPVTPRLTKFIQKWLQMVYTGDAGPLANYAARITNITSCEKSKEVLKARWWGMDEFLFCAECFEEVGKTSYFAPQFNYHGASFPEARCDMYTDNMRRRYLEACKERSLDEFMNYCHYREEIWQLMKQEMQRHKMMIKMSERQHSYGTLMPPPPIYRPVVEPGTAMVPMRPDLARQRRVSAPAKFEHEHDHRMTEENLKRAQRKAVRESMQKSPTLVHLQTRWSEVE